MSKNASTVFFHGYAKGGNPLGGIARLLEKSAFQEMIPKGGRVLIKLHMGELGNIRYIRPIFVSKVVDIVKNTGGVPFLFDTVVAYPGARTTKEEYLSTAAMNGFVEASVSAPIVIGDDGDKQVTFTVKNRIDDCRLTEIEVPELLMKSACIIVLSHVKGHVLSGFGGAIKSLGMGCVSTRTKQAQHLVNRPLFNSESDCDECGTCVEACPSEAIELVEGKPKQSSEKCTSCGSCFFECPTRCWVWPPGAKEKLQVYLGHTASTLIAAYKGKVGFMNFIQDITPHCDCAAPSGQPLVQDIGIAFSLDPVAVDKASLDLIDQAPIIPGSTLKVPPDILGKMYHTDSLIQLKTAEKLDIGTLNYELVSI